MVELRWMLLRMIFGPEALCNVRTAKADQKRQRAAALQELALVRSSIELAQASWSAAVLCRSDRDGPIADERIVLEFRQELVFTFYVSVHSLTVSPPPLSRRPGSSPGTAWRNLPAQTD